MRRMARLAPSCSDITPILVLSAAFGLSITQPRDLKYCVMLRDLMRRTKDNGESESTYAEVEIAKSIASMVWSVT